MSDNDGKKTLGVGGGRGGRPGNVKQSFSHGRTKSVVVETKRKRVVVPKPGTPKPTTGAAPAGDPSRRPSGISDAEMDRRMKALQAAKAREAEDAAKRKAEEEERAAERQRRRDEAEAKEREEKEREEALKAKAQEDERKKNEAAEAARRAAEPAPAPAADDRKSAGRKAPERDAPRRQEEQRPQKGRDDGGRRGGKLTLNQALRGGEGGRQRSMAAMKRKQERARQKAMGGSVEREKVVRDVQVPEAILVSELANRIAERVPDVVKSLMQMGMMVTQNQTIDQD
ncbi:MAG: translation initiation factor IF-2 associated domain-containing protein, partial [Pseudomonadota bacterium]